MFTVLVCPTNFSNKKKARKEKKNGNFFFFRKTNKRSTFVCNLHLETKDTSLSNNKKLGVDLNISYFITCKYSEE